METVKLPTLYKKTGEKIQQWNISVQLIDDVPTIVTEYGHVGGNSQTVNDPVTAGKNTGKANATTPWQQAIKDAESKHAKKIKSDKYSTDATGGESAAKRAISCMLADPFIDKNKKKVAIDWKAGVYIQPKLDGRRGMSHTYADKIVQYSRGDDLVTTMTHIVEQLKEAWQAALTKAFGLSSDICIIPDGEFYTTKVDFESIGSALTTEGGNEHSGLIDYHVYDVLVPSTPTLKFSERYNKLRETVKETANIKFVETHLVHSEEEMLEYVGKWVEQGYEGGMIRVDAPYKPSGRSKDLLKVKNFDETEFKVIGVKPGDRGKAQKHAMFVCECPGGIPDPFFTVTAQGNNANKEKLLKEGDANIGKWLTVKHFGYTKYNIPRFPVSKAFRDKSDMTCS